MILTTMSESHGFILDTNLIVSAALYPGRTPQLALEHALKNGVLLFSDATRFEVERVLFKPKFDRYLTQDERRQFLNAISLSSKFVEVTTIVTDCRDPKDNIFLSLAIDASASAIVTGDDDLLTLHPYRKIDILTPAAFLETNYIADPGN
jgi:uncharacterized protein